MEAVFSENYWLAIRCITSAHRKRGDGLSKAWSREALIILNNNFPQHNFKPYKENTNPLITSIEPHQFLGRETEKGLFIADGTAGQLEPACIRGFYGLIRCAPETLRDIYEQAFILSKEVL